MTRPRRERDAGVFDFPKKVGALIAVLGPAGSLLLMKERTRNLRRLGIAGTIAAFLAAWAIVFGQLVLGHDPALGAQKSTQTQAQPQTATQSQDTTSDDSESSASSPAPVTTSQS